MKIASRTHPVGWRTSTPVAAFSPTPADPSRSSLLLAVAPERRHDAEVGRSHDAVAAEIESRTGYETRVTVLGHVQRGGSPTAFDRVLATRFGLNAIEAVKDEAWGTMVALQGTDIVRVPLQEATGTLKTVPIERYEEAMAFFG